MGAGNGPGLREIELVLCVWLTKCVANSVADCKETNRKSRRRLGDALEGLGIGDPPEWLRAAQLLHGATLHWLLCGPKCIRAAHSPWSSSYIYTYILYIYICICTDVRRCMARSCLCKYLSLSLSFGGENASMTYSCRQTNVRWADTSRNWPLMKV